MLPLGLLQFGLRVRGSNSAIARITDGIYRTIAVPSAVKSGWSWHGCPTSQLRFSASNYSPCVSGLMLKIADRLARVSSLPVKGHLRPETVEIV